MSTPIRAARTADAAAIAACGDTAYRHDLYTHALMHENIAWYARNGYAETARVREKGFDRVYMRKALAPPPPTTG